MDAVPVSDPDFMMSLARGLTVIRCFANEQRPMTVAMAASATGLSRSAVKRCLHTLVELGYAQQDGSNYRLRAKVLELGFAYLSSSPLAARAQPVLDRLRDDLQESCSLGVLEGSMVSYIARAETRRIMSIGLNVGSRLPLYCTSMGRVLLAAEPLASQGAYLARTSREAFTEHTQIDGSALTNILAKAREDGFAIVDEELEYGLRSIAVPVTGPRGVVAALNVGTQASRVPVAHLRSVCLPALRRAAQEIASQL